MSEMTRQRIETINIINYADVPEWEIWEAINQGVICYEDVENIIDMEED